MSVMLAESMHRIGGLLQSVSTARRTRNWNRWWRKSHLRGRAAASGWRKQALGDIAQAESCYGAPSNDPQSTPH